MIAMPQAYGQDRGRAGVDGRMVDFYEYYAGVQEAWDGPAPVVFADGRYAGARLDRNGLRPARSVCARPSRVSVGRAT